METVDDEIRDLAINFMDKAKKDGKPYFVWLNPTRMHIERFAPEGRVARLYLVQHDAEREEIGAMVDVMPVPAEELGRDVAGRTDDSAVAEPTARRVARRNGRDRARRVDPCDAEVGEINLAEFPEENVRGLDVAMNDAARVRIGKRPRDLRHHGDQTTDRPGIAVGPREDVAE